MSAPGLAYRPFPLVLAAPSGTGKTTIARTLVERFDDVVFSISATTRAPRKGEVDGRDYHFLSRVAFEAEIANGSLVEWAEVHGNLYGTPRRSLEEALQRGEHPLLDIDVQGAGQIREQVPEAVRIFVFPPSAEVLRARLTARGTEDPEEVARRLRAAQRELEEAVHFDYIVVNEELERAVREVREILAAEGRRPARRARLDARIAELQGEISEVLEKGDFHNR
jgi:guanylate kinase